MPNTCASPPSRFKLALAMATAGCGIDNVETAAVEVAEQWTEDNINDVSEVLVNLVMEAPVVADTLRGKMHILSRPDRASDMLADAFFPARQREYLVVNYGRPPLV